VWYVHVCTCVCVSVCVSVCARGEREREKEMNARSVASHACILVALSESKRGFVSEAAAELTRSSSVDVLRIRLRVYALGAIVVSESRIKADRQLLPFVRPAFLGLFARMRKRARETNLTILPSEISPPKLIHRFLAREREGVWDSRDKSNLDLATYHARNMNGDIRAYREIDPSEC